MAAGSAKTEPSLNLKAGDWVEVRSKEEILRTLDVKGELDGMPFMPEMIQFCGKRLQVYKRAHKTCDTVFPIRGRRVDRAVHLDTRCDGSAHGGCQAGCLIFWKEAWLKPVNTSAPAITGISTNGNGAGNRAGCSEQELLAAVQKPEPETGLPVYSCQATRLPYFTTDLNWWEVGQYMEDYRSGNISFLRLLQGAAYSFYFHVSQMGIGVGRPMRWLYDKAAPLWTKTHFPRHAGPIPEGEPTPAEKLNLQPGEQVRVKSHKAILATLNTGSRNRGLWWDAEMVPYCGGTYRVLKRVTTIVDEKTGKMMEMKNPCIILDKVVCQARYSDCRMFCPRAIYPYWREIWLERVEPQKTEGKDLVTISGELAQPAARER